MFTDVYNSLRIFFRKLDVGEKVKVYICKIISELKMVEDGCFAYWMFILLIPSSLNRLEIFNDNTSFYRKIRVLSQIQGLHIQCSWNTNQSEDKWEQKPSPVLSYQAICLGGQGYQQEEERNVFFLMFHSEAILLLMIRNHPLKICIKMTNRGLLTGITFKN